MWSRVLWISSDAPAPDTFRDPDTRRKFEPIFAENLASALEILRQNPVQAILIHLPIGDCSAEELLTQLRNAGEQAPVVVYEPDGQVTRSAADDTPGRFSVHLPARAARKNFERCCWLRSATDPRRPQA